MHHISKQLDFIRTNLFALFLVAAIYPVPSAAATLKSLTIEGFVAKPPVHVMGTDTSAPKGLSPDQIKAAYRLPKSGGSGTIAIVTAYDSPTIESDLAAFNAKFNLPACTIADKCLEKHPMNRTMRQSPGWALETALDTEWAHAIAPDAKILVVESVSSSGPDLMKAVDYARGRSDVTAISMSWGGKEFKDETKMDSHFTSSHGAAFFAASGDEGTGPSWPAASSKVVAVGGTSLAFKKDGSYDSEKAWSGSGGGTSAFEPEPGFQMSYSIAKAGGKRAIPDVAFHADPKMGYSVYHQKTATASSTKNGWYVVGGTSAGAPQWAAIKALDASNAANSTSSISYLTQLYEDKASANHSKFFRDITVGSNGDCGYYCDARKHYDYVTGLGAPLTYSF